MNIVESNYQKYLTFLEEEDSVTALLWARLILSDICEEIYLDNGRDILPKDNTDSRLRDITKLAWIDPLILLELRVIQNRSNFALHATANQRGTINKEYCDDPSKSLIKIMKWYRTKNGLDEPLQSLIATKKIKPTFSNLHFYSDIKEYDNKKYLSNSLPHNRTIFIVVGSSLNSELLERPLAENLRNEIEKKYDYRAYIVNDQYYMSLDKLQKFPAISIGDNVDNKLTLQITNYGKSKSNYGKAEAVTQIGGAYKIAIWGKCNKHTQGKVENFIKSEDGLRSFFGRFLRDVN